VVVGDGEAEPGVRVEPAAGGRQEDGGRRHGELWGEEEPAQVEAALVGTVLWTPGQSGTIC